MLCLQPITCAPICFSGQATWSTFYLAAAEAMHEVEGQLTIASHVLRSTVAHRYLRDSAMQTLVHQDLVRYFQQPLDEMTEARRMQVRPAASLRPTTLVVGI